MRISRNDSLGVGESSGSHAHTLRSLLSRRVISKARAAALCGQLLLTALTPSCLLTLLYQRQLSYSSNIFACHGQTKFAWLGQAGRTHIFLAYWQLPPLPFLLPPPSLPIENVSAWLAGMVHVCPCLVLAG